MVLLFLEGHMLSNQCTLVGVNYENHWHIMNSCLQLFIFRNYWPQYRALWHYNLIHSILTSISALFLAPLSLLIADLLLRFWASAARITFSTVWSDLKLPQNLVNLKQSTNIVTLMTVNTKLTSELDSQPTKLKLHVGRASYIGICNKIIHI